MKRMLSAILAAAMIFALLPIPMARAATVTTGSAHGEVESVEVKSTGLGKVEVTVTLKSDAGAGNYSCVAFSDEYLRLVNMMGLQIDKNIVSSADTTADSIVGMLGATGRPEAGYYGSAEFKPFSDRKATFTLTVPKTAADTSTSAMGTAPNLSGYDQTGGVKVNFYIITNTSKGNWGTYSFVLPQSGELPKEQVTITWNSNGATKPANPATSSVDEGSTLGEDDFPSAPEKTGWHFMGWYTADSGGDEVSKDTNTVVSADVEYFAQWAKEYDLTWSPNGGSGTAITETVWEGKEIASKSDSGFTKDGMVITGWSTSAGDNSGSPVTFPYTMPGANTTLHAIWGASGVSVEWNGPTSITGTYGGTTDKQATYTVTTPAPYNGTVSYTSNDTSVVTVDNNGNVTIVGAGSTTITVSATADGIYAAPEDATVSVTISPATLGVPSVTPNAPSTTDSEVGTVTIGTVTGATGYEYKLEGADDSTAAVATDGMHMPAAGKYVFRAVSTSSNYTTPSDWSAAVAVNATYKVTYDAGTDGSGAKAPGFVTTTGGEKAVALGALVTDGTELSNSDAAMKFIGWSKNADSTAVSSEITIEGDTTLTAIWKDRDPSNPKVDEKGTADNYVITKTYGDSAWTPAYTRTGTGTESWSVVSGTSVTLGANGELTIAGVGETTIKYSVAATDTHAAGEVTFKVKVEPKKLTAADISFTGDFTDMTYLGKDDVSIPAANSTGVTAAVSSKVNAADTVKVTPVFTRADANANTSGVQVNVTVTLSDDEGKYVLDSGINGTAFDSGKTIVVNPVELTVADVKIEKDYNGTDALESDDTTAITSATLNGKISGDDVTLDASGVTYLNGGSATTTTDNGGYDVLKAADALTLTGAQAGNYKIAAGSTGRILGKVKAADMGTLSINASNTTYNAADADKGTVTVTGYPTGATVEYKVVDDTTTNITDEAGWTGVTSSGTFATIDGTTGKITGVKATGNTGDPTDLTVWAKVSLANYKTQYIHATFQVEKAEQTLTVSPNAITSGFYTSGTKDLELESNAYGSDGFAWTNVTVTSADPAKVSVPTNASAGTGNKGTVTLTGVAEGGPVNIIIAAPATTNYKAAAVTVPVTVTPAGGNTLEADPADLMYGDELDLRGLLKDQNSNGAITYELANPSDSSKVDLTGSTLKAKDHTGTVDIKITQAAGEDEDNGDAPINAKTLTVTITLKPKAVKVDGPIKAKDRDYDGTTVVEIDKANSTLTLSGVVDGEDVSIDTTGTINGTIEDKDVGSGKTVTIDTDATHANALKLTGTDAGHYVLDTADLPAVTVNITKADLDGWNTTDPADNTSATKPYTGAKTGAALTLANKTLTGVNGETFTLTANKTTVDYKDDLTVPNGWNASDICTFEIALDDFTVTGNTGSGGTLAKESNYNMPSTPLTYNTGEITQINVILTLSGKDAGNNALGASQTYGDGPFTLSVTAKNKDTGGTVELTTTGANATTVTYTAADVTGTGVASVTGSNVLNILKSGKFKVTVSATDTRNYKFVANAATDTIECTVGKLELTLAETSIIGKISDGATGVALLDSKYVKTPTGSKTLAEIETELSMGANSLLSYSVIDDPTDLTDNEALAAITGKQLTWTGLVVDKTAKIKVTMTANDYYTLADPSLITLTLKNKDEIGVTFDDASFTYNGAERLYSEVMNKLKVDGRTPVAADEGKFEFSYEDGATTVTGLPKNAGTYTVTVTYEDDTHIGSDTAEITINKAPVTIQVGDTTKTYGDSSVTWGAISATLLGDDETIAANKSAILGSLALASDGTDAEAEVKGYPITVTDNNTAKNYEWTVDSTSKLEVTKKDISVTVTATKEYNGTNAIDDTSTVTITLNPSDIMNNDDLGSDPLTINKSALKYNTKNVHTNENLTGTLELAGAAAKNYNLTTTLDSGDCTGTITPKTGVVVHLKPATTISGNTIKLGDVITAEGLIPSDTPNALVTKPDGTEDWVYDGNGVYTSPTAGVTATVYEKQPDGTYEKITGNPTAGKTYYVDVDVPTGTLGNYTVATGLDQQGHKPADDDEANGGGYCKVTISRAPSSPIVSYVAGEHGKLAEGSQNYELVRIGEKPVHVPEVEPDEGYRFAGWSTDGGETFVKPDEVEVTGSITYTAIFVEDSEHIAYMIGRGDKQFVPNGNLTRAEAAAILARLSPDFSEKTEYGCTFTDVNRGVWFYNYIAFCQTKGIVIGNGNNTFRPDSSISRAELAAMVVRFLDVNPSAWKCTFTDVSEKHWANGYIAVLQRLGIVKGDGNGKFRPGDFITRYETTILINRAINRTPDPKLELTDGGYRNPFSDITEAQWYYEDVIEATVDHNAKDFHRDPVTGESTETMPGTSRSKDDDKDKDKDSKKEENATDPKVD